MPRVTNPQIADMIGTVSLPRRSGELVFHDLWERRVFALAVALCEQGLYSWDEFRDRLIAEIEAAEQTAASEPTSAPPPGYYEHWLAAFEKLLIAKAFVRLSSCDSSLILGQNNLGVPTATSNSVSSFSPLCPAVPPCPADNRKQERGEVCSKKPLNQSTTLREATLLLKKSGYALRSSD
jgi:nitrile hydratase accessory protein